MRPSLVRSLLGVIVLPAAAAATAVGCGSAEETSATSEAAISSHELRRDRIAVVGARPNPAASRCAYDSKQKNIVLFAGSAAEGTWTWNGVKWTLRSSAGPSPRTEFGLGFDEKRGVTVLFGGVAASGELLDDVWEFDGTNWEVGAPVGARPPAQKNAQLAFDRTRQALVLLGDASVNAWEYDGAAWTKSAATIPANTKVRTAATAKDGKAFFVTWAPSELYGLKGWRYTGGTFEPASAQQFSPGTTRIYFEAARQLMTFVSHYFVVDETGAILGNSAGAAAAPCLAYDVQRNRLVTWGPQTAAVEEVWQATAASEHAPRTPQVEELEVFATESLDHPLAGSDDEDPYGALRWSSADLPSGATLDPSGRLRWTPTASQAGVHQFSVTVRDTSGRTSTGAVRVDAKWLRYSQLPQGTVSLVSPKVRLPVVNVSRSVADNSPDETLNDEGAVRCSLSGKNPYKVTVKCDLALGIAMVDDRPSETTSTEGVLDEAGSFRLSGVRVLRGHLINDAGSPALVIEGLEWRDAAFYIDIRSRGPVTLPLLPN